MKAKKNNRLFLILFAGWFLLGLTCDFFYHQSPGASIDQTRIKSVLAQKEFVAQNMMRRIKDSVIVSSKLSLNRINFPDNDISYYVFDKKTLVFWSDNSLDISDVSFGDSADFYMAVLPNAYCLVTTERFQNYSCMALIKIKNNYPYENKELSNVYNRKLNLDKSIEINTDPAMHKGASFYNRFGKFLFSLSQPQLPVYNQLWSRMGMIAYFVAFCLLFVLLGRFPLIVGQRSISIRAFVFIAFASGVVISLLLYFNIPDILFVNKIFTPYQYAANAFLSSIIHLAIASGLLVSLVYLFYFHTVTDRYRNLSYHQLLSACYGLFLFLVYYLIYGLIQHSSIQINVLDIQNISFITLFVHLIILTWGIGLVMFFYKTHQWFYYRKLLRLSVLTDAVTGFALMAVMYSVDSSEVFRFGLSYLVVTLVFYCRYMFPVRKYNYRFLLLWTFVYSCFFIINSVFMVNNKKEDKYKILAQNINVNGNVDNDKMADILLEELEKQIIKDRKITKLITNTDSVTLANNYLNITYLRGFWNKYEMHLTATELHSNLYNEYRDFINNAGTKLKDTHFFSVPSNQNNMSYIGSFQFKPLRGDTIVFFMEFYPRRNFKSYSFPNLLIASSPDIQQNLNIGIAKYDKDKLVYSSGKYDYPLDDLWLPQRKNEFSRALVNDNFHFIYWSGPRSCIVITDLQPYNIKMYILYFLYTFFSFYALCWLLVWGVKFTNRNRVLRLGLTTKFQFTFIGLLIVSFFGIFYVSVNFIQNKYQEEQIANLENKKTYIQKALQDMYYWNQNLNALNTQTLNFDLQDLSYIYHTDIHVYDNNGMLIGSSQPLIFNKNLISRRLSPKVFFSSKSTLNQYEHIGNLNYLSGYTDFVNGDYLQIGYIAIPQFFSQDEIRSEIENFLTVIIHIYLIIIILAIMLSLIIGRQLSAPLILIEDKLKSMRLGRRNEKIDYNINDEVGQLVAQYNRTIDELEQSARLLAKSERETAWKSMARQVAHEINNPLTPMKLSIQQLQRTKQMNDERFDDYFEKSTAMLIEQIDNLSRIAGTFSSFARMPEANFDKVDIASILYSAVTLFTNNVENAEVSYLGIKRNCYIFADSKQMVQVFNNLLKNAIQAIPETRPGKIVVGIDVLGNDVHITISDNGCGIDDDIKEKLFVPNFTTKNTGMGLGLAIVKNIVEISGGSILFTSVLNEGTSFRLTFPLAL